MSAARLSPRARRDLIEAARWIARDDPQAATALRNAIVVAARRIGEHSGSGRERPQVLDPPGRFLVLTGFPYVLVYDADRRPPLVLRVLHGARDLPEVLAGE